MHLLAIFIRGTWWLGIILTAILVILTRLLYSLSPNKRKWIGMGILSAIGIFLILVSMYYMPFRHGEKHPVAAMLVYAGTTMEYNAQGNLGYHNFTCLLLDAQTEYNDPFADGQFQFEFKESLDSPNGTFDNKKAFFYY